MNVDFHFKASVSISTLKPHTHTHIERLDQLYDYTLVIGRHSVLFKSEQDAILEILNENLKDKENID